MNSALDERPPEDALGSCSAIVTWSCLVGLLSTVAVEHINGLVASHACGRCSSLDATATATGRNKFTNALSYPPRLGVAFGVGLALVHVNASAIAWYPSSTLAWRPGELEVDGWDDRDGHLGWPTTYFYVSRGGFEQRPSFCWLDVPFAVRGRTAFLAPMKHVVNVVWASAILIAVWHVSGLLVQATCGGQFTLRTAFVVMTGAAVFAFLEFNDWGACHNWEAYDEKPYLTCSALYHWFGSRSSFDWLCRFPLIVQVPILLGWLSMVVVVCSSLVAWGRRLRRRTGEPAASPSVDQG